MLVTFFETLLRDGNDKIKIYVQMQFFWDEWFPIEFFALFNCICT